MFGMDYYSLFLNNEHHRENYILVDDYGLKKTLIPFVFNKSITHFEAKSLLKLDPRKIRSIEYIHYENLNKKHQENLNRSRIDTLVSLLGPKINNINPSVYKKIVLSNEHITTTQFTGFIITSELSEYEYQLLLKEILKNEDKSESKATFTQDTLKPYGYILPHIHATHKLKEFSVISRVFNRNKHWKNKLIVADVTGSMTPYLAKFLLWLKLNFNSNEVQNYVFFNDGNDSKGFRIKEVGKTGGLYYTQNKLGYLNIEKTIITAMLNGSGGDLPENNIEALIAGEKNYSQSGHIILIADNYASPRDMELLSKLKKPVNVILCGVKNGEINLDYLTLAYKTKGTVHTIEEDLTKLIIMKEGQTFTFSGNFYKIQNGEVIEVNNESKKG